MSLKGLVLAIGAALIVVATFQTWDSSNVAMQENSGNMRSSSPITILESVSGRNEMHLTNLPSDNDKQAIQLDENNTRDTSINLEPAVQVRETEHGKVIDDGSGELKLQVEHEGKVFTAVMGVRGGDDRGYNFFRYQNPYADYSDEDLSKMSSQNDRVAQYLLGTRLLARTGNLKEAENLLHSAANLGYTVAYRSMANYHISNGDLTKAYAYKYITEASGDTYVSSKSSIYKGLTARLSEEEKEEARKIAKEIQEQSN